MFPSLAICSGARTILDMQTVEPLKPESQLLKLLTQSNYVPPVRQMPHAPHYIHLM